VIDLRAALQRDFGPQPADESWPREPDMPPDQPASSWAPIDLTAALDGDDLPKPEILSRTDMVCLLYAARTHAFQGESETLKSMAAQAGAGQVLNTGGWVLWIDFEDDEHGVTSRLRSMGLARDVILNRFRYLRPDEPLADRHGKATAGHADLDELLATHRFNLAVIDGVTEAMTTEGLDLMSNADIAIWSRRLPRRLADHGAAAVVIDHLPKNRENHGRFAIGGQHKLAGITGAAYRFDAVRPLSRAIDTEVTGIVTITVTKDRVGHVRAHADENGRIATMEVTAWPDGGLTVVVAPPNTAAVDLRLCRRIAEHLAIYDGAAKSAIEKSVSGKTDAIRDTLTHMVQNGWLTVEQVGSAHRHHLTDDGRETFLNDHEP
jgi:hypothetical protein